MHYFRTKAYTGTCEQFWPNKTPWPEGVKVQDKDFWNTPHDPFYYLDTPDEAIHINPGDWIIQKEWHRYALSNDYFLKYYELMEDPDALL